MLVISHTHTHTHTHTQGQSDFRRCNGGGWYIWHTGWLRTLQEAWSMDEEGGGLCLCHGDVVGHTFPLLFHCCGSIPTTLSGLGQCIYYVHV